MGTYYKAANLDRHEFMDPATFGQTMKVQEFTEGSAGIMEALALLLLEGGSGVVEGRWAGDRVVFASVYGEEDDDGLTLYRRVEQDPIYRDVGPDVLKLMAESRVTRRRLVERARSGPWDRLRGSLDDLGVEWRETAQSSQTGARRKMADTDEQQETVTEREHLREIVSSPDWDGSCPKCESPSVWYYEGPRRAVFGVRDGEVFVDVHAETHPFLRCSDCGVQWPVPDDCKVRVAGADEWVACGGRSRRRQVDG